MLLLAQIAGLSLVQLAIAVIFIAAVVAIVFVAVRAMGLAIPAWLIQVFWIVIAAFVCIAAIRLLMSM